jgi:hypothetical protein
MKKPIASGLAMLFALMLLVGCADTNTDNVSALSLSSSYEITAVLDPYGKILEHTTHVQVQNNGQNSTKELYFHLYGNLYKSESEGIEVISVVNDKDTALPHEMKDNDQLILLTLIDALAPGERATIIFSCRVTIPAVESIYGISRDGEIHLPFFYPELAMFDNNGWNTKSLAQHGDGRYLAVSDYVFTIQVPSEYEVACNGIELATVSNKGQTTYTFQANQRRELVFTAFTDYVRLKRSVQDTEIFGYFNERFHSLSDMENAMDAAVLSMEYYNRIYMDYPFETLVITNGAWGRTPVSMEYSGFFTVWQMSGVEGMMTVFHEMAHQWFYFLVGNNEYTEPWLDEAFATFSAQLCLKAAGYVESYDTWWEIYKIMSDTMNNRAVNVGYDDTDNPLSLFYGRGATFLKELMYMIGEDEFVSILSEYCTTYAFEFASTEGFLTLVRERVTVDIDSIIDEYVVIN